MKASSPAGGSKFDGWLVFIESIRFFGASIIVTGYMQMKICVAEESWRSRRVSLGHCASAFVHTTSTWSMSLPTPLGRVRNTWHFPMVFAKFNIDPLHWFVLNWHKIKHLQCLGETKSGPLKPSSQILCISAVWPQLSTFGCWIIFERMSEVRQSFQVWIRAKNSWYHQPEDDKCLPQKPAPRCYSPLHSHFASHILALTNHIIMTLDKWKQNIKILKNVG